MYAVTPSYDKQSSAVVPDAEKVISIIENCISKGLLWSLTTFDLNEKLDYVHFVLIHSDE